MIREDAALLAALVPLDFTQFLLTVLFLKSKWTCGLLVEILPSGQEGALGWFLALNKRNSEVGGSVRGWLYIYA